MSARFISQNDWTSPTLAQASYARSSNAATLTGGGGAYPGQVSTHASNSDPSTGYLPRAAVYQVNTGRRIKHKSSVVFVLGLLAITMWLEGGKR